MSTFEILEDQSPSDIRVGDKVIVSVFKLEDDYTVVEVYSAEMRVSGGEDELMLVQPGSHSMSLRKIRHDVITIVRSIR